MDCLKHHEQQQKQAGQSTHASPDLRRSERERPFVNIPILEDSNTTTAIAATLVFLYPLPGYVCKYCVCYTRCFYLPPSRRNSIAEKDLYSDIPSTTHFEICLLPSFLFFSLSLISILPPHFWTGGCFCPIKHLMASWNNARRLRLKI